MFPRTEHNDQETDAVNKSNLDKSEFPWWGKPRERLTGLLNQGGTCYLNTLLQTLLHTPEFTSRLFNLTKKVKKEHLKRMIQEMLNLFSALFTSSGIAISSKPLTDSFGWTEDEVCVHQDIQELNRLLFEQIEIALKDTPETNLISDLFRGVQCTRIRCLRCGRVSERNDEFQDINLSVIEYDSVEASLAAHTQMERLTGDNKYYCEVCKIKVDAVKMTRFDELPPILTLSLSRFYFDAKSMQSVKLEKMCSFPLVLDMTNFLLRPTSKPVKYDLFSVVLHVGGSTGGGHYHAFIKDPYGTIRESSKDSASNNKIRDTPYQLATNGVLDTNGDGGIRFPAFDHEGSTQFSRDERDAMALCRQPGSNRLRPLSKRTGGGDTKAGLKDVSGDRRKKTVQTDSNIVHMPKLSEGAVWNPTEEIFRKRSSSDLSGRLSDDEMLMAEATLTHSGAQKSVRSTGKTPIDGLVEEVKSSLNINGETNRKLHTDESTRASHYRLSSIQKNIPKESRRRARLTNTAKGWKTGVRNLSTPTRSIQISGTPADAVAIYAVSLPETCDPGKQHEQHLHSAHKSVLRKRPSDDVKSSITKTRHPADHPGSGFNTCKQNQSTYRPSKSQLASVTRNPNNKGSLESLPFLQTNQHNIERKKGSSASVTSSSQSVHNLGTSNLNSGFDPRAPRNLSDCKWRSRLFDGVRSNPPPGVHAHPTNLSESMQEARDFNRSSPSYVELDIVPSIQRVDARVPSHWTTLRDNELEESTIPRRNIAYGKCVNRSSSNEPSCGTYGPRNPQTGGETNNLEAPVNRDNSARCYTSDNDRHDIESSEPPPEIVVGRWFDINDDFIVEVDPSVFPKVFEGPECAYMLFYRLMNLKTSVNP
ncbi:unnamed protein product [Calicophoron daubneyi]|uniref:USP domain-containing protein n=1 Tax=Calicophoron daubneyi TaxID=300641 RepID=A0AAV2T043_CALDB